MLVGTFSIFHSMVIVRTTWCLVGLATASILQFIVPDRSNNPKEEESKAECVICHDQGTLAQ
jgi:hypothetical protein